MLSDLLSVSSGLVLPCLLSPWLGGWQHAGNGPGRTHIQSTGNLDCPGSWWEVPYPHCSSTFTPLFFLFCLKLVSWQFYSVSHADIQSSVRPSIPLGIRAVGHLATHLGFPFSNPPPPPPWDSGQGTGPLLREKTTHKLSFLSPSLLLPQLCQPLSGLCRQASWALYQFSSHSVFYTIIWRLTFLQVFCFPKHPALRN